MLANAARVANESLDLTPSGSAGKFWGDCFQSLDTFSIFGFLKQHYAQIEIAFHAPGTAAKAALKAVSACLRSPCRPKTIPR